MTDHTYTFEMPVSDLFDDADLSTIGTYHRALGCVTEFSESYRSGL